MFDRSWLVAFSALVEAGTFMGAARKLHLSQPAVHQQVKRLAEAVGMPLYVRAGRGIALTREGVEVAAFAADLEARAKALVGRLRGDATTAPLVLAAGAGAVLYVVGDGLRAFARAGGHVRVDIVTADATASVELVRRGAAHAGVAVLDAPPAGLATTLLTEVEQVLIVPKASRLAKKKKVHLADLRGERLVVPPPGRPHRAMIDATLASRGIEWSPGAQASGWELMVRLVELGAGAAIVNGTCRLPRHVVGRPLPELPKVRYFTFTREDARPEAVTLRKTLAEHGDAWRPGALSATSRSGSRANRG